MLGRLTLLATKKDIQSDLERFKEAKKLTDVVFDSEYSEPLLQLLGARITDSIDYSDYEKATIIHDLNKPIGNELKNKYTAVIDGGTIEHVFNFPVAIKNAMEMLKVGGHYIGITPVNNTMGHGFYQYSPELFFNIFNSNNGFETKKIIIYTHDEDGVSDWYEVVDPSKIKNRVMLVNNKPTYLLVMAQKTADVPIFATTPQQSDYQTLWAIRKALQENKAPENESKLKFIYRKYTPKFLKIFLHNVYDLFTKEKIVNKDLGAIDAGHFKKMELPQK
jgi:hypothetical protein